MTPFRSESIDIRGLRYHIRHWGDPQAPMLFMLHGWMDVSASFQFLVDAFVHEWHVIAPDWRGFGLTEHAASSYWFPDYMADLDVLLLHYSPQQPVNLLGHSLGANVAGMYAGTRADRVKNLIMLEGFGLPATQPAQAAVRYAKWLDELRTPPVLRTYARLEDVAARLQKNNPRLNNERAIFLAGHWAAQNGSGNWQILADPAHRLSNPNLYRVEEVMACWTAITAPVLWVEGRDSELVARLGGTKGTAGARAEIDRRTACIGKLTPLMVHDAGHMLQHDQPEVLAEAIEQFLQR